MSHNSNDAAVAAPPDLPFRLSGSQRKTAYALEKNVARLVTEAGLECTGFLTLTVGDDEGDGFRQVWDAKEASRRINSLATGLLRTLFRRWVIVTERHKSGAIHFHLIVECGADIRTGFDFAAFKERSGYAASASEHLRALWTILREQLPSYGFGRSELAPIYATGEAVSRYVSKYVEKNLFSRLPEDKGKKLVRYHGFNGTQMKPNDFAWATPRAAAWRSKAAQLAGMVGADRSNVAACFGKRWSFVLTEVMNLANETRAAESELQPMAIGSWPVRSLVTQMLREKSSPAFLREWDARRSVSPVQWRPRTRAASRTFAELGL